MTSRALPDPKAEPTLTVGRVAAILGVSTRTIYTRVAEDETFPAIRVGTSIRIPTARFLAHYGLNYSADAPPATQSWRRVHVRRTIPVSRGR